MVYLVVPGQRFYFRLFFTPMFILAFKLFSRNRKSDRNESGLSDPRFDFGKSETFDYISIDGFFLEKLTSYAKTAII